MNEGVIHDLGVNPPSLVDKGLKVTLEWGPTGIAADRNALSVIPQTMPHKDNQHGPMRSTRNRSSPT
jgi:hypothetical protein